MYSWLPSKLMGLSGLVSETYYGQSKYFLELSWWFHGVAGKEYLSFITYSSRLAGALGFPVCWAVG